MECCGTRKLQEKGISYIFSPLHVSGVIHAHRGRQQSIQT